MIKNRLFWLFCCGWWTGQVLAQEIPLGAWRMHLTYQNAQAIALTPKSAFVASANGLFEFQIADQKITPLFKKIDGLSDIGISRLAYHSPTQTLVMAYQNGNIDLYKTNEIINVRSILNTNFESKHIQHLDFQDNNLYISTDFGVVVFDLQKNEVRESYTQLGERGETIAVYSLAFTTDSLFALTDKGIRATTRNPQINKQDFRNWRTVWSNPNLVRSLVALNNTVFGAVQRQNLFSYQNGRIQYLTAAGQADWKDLSVANSQVVVSVAGKILVISENQQIQTFSDAKIVQPQQALINAENKLWIADGAIGLVTNQYGSFQQFAPSGVYAADIWDLKYFDNKIIATTGGHQDRYLPFNRQTGFYVFENGKWTNFNAIDPFNFSIKTPLMRDLLTSTYHPLEKRFYLASFQDGLLAWNPENNDFQVFNNPQTPFEGNRVGGLTLDLTNQLWVANHNVRTNSPSIFKRNADGSWRGFRFPDDEQLNANRPLDLMTDDQNNIWVRLSPNTGGGALVLNEAGQYKYLKANNLDGADLNINAMIFDKSGSLWLGTDRGLRVIGGASVFLERNLNAQKLAVGNNAFLFLEKITAIAVDGGNRKWIGTEKGLWLYDDRKQEAIHQFTAENSPLLSNKIRSIAVHALTGEVFIGTDLGIVSYRGTATEGNLDFAQAKIFPNPVPPNFNGYITISGLATDANVKIVDISGKIVFETVAQGGTAVWQGTDLSGRKVKTGMYLVYSAFRQGEETFVGKIGFVE